MAAVGLPTPHNVAVDLMDMDLAPQKSEVFLRCFDVPRPTVLSPGVVDDCLPPRLAPGCKSLEELENMNRIGFKNVARPL